MHNNIRLASYRPSGQGEVGYEAEQGDRYCPDHPVYYRRDVGTGHTQRSLRGPYPKRTDRGRRLHSLRIC